MDTILAALPLVVVLALMVGFKWSGAKAGAAGWVCALGVALVRFRIGGQALLWAQVQGSFRAVYVLYIIWGALFFFRVTEADGTLRAMSDMLQQLAPGRIMQVLLLAWGFASFLQGVGGFGVPVAVVAPILVSMGFSALQSVVMASLGLGWAVSFGSLGASYEALVTATGLDGAVIGPWMAGLLGVACVTIGFLVLWLANGRRLSRHELTPMLLMAMTMAGVQYLAIHIGVANIAAMLGALSGIVVGGVWASFLRHRQRPPTDGDDAAPSNPACPTPADHISLYKVLPYLILIGVIFAVNFVPVLNDLVNRWVVAVRVPALTLPDGVRQAATRTKGISLFGHPGAQLIYAALMTLLLAKVRGRLPPGSGAQIRRGVLRSGTKSTLGILAMMAMATTMQTAGMVSQLATAMASVAGKMFPLISPWLGALGAFMTGSNTNSNVLLGAFQRQVADSLDLQVPLILALHNAGAALGSVFSPAKIIVGCSTVGLTGREGEALRRTMRYGVAIIAVVTIAGFVVGQLTPGL